MFWHVLLYDNLLNDYFVWPLGETVVEAETQELAEELARAEFDYLGQSIVQIKPIGSTREELRGHYSNRAHELLSQMDEEHKLEVASAQRQELLCKQAESMLVKAMATKRLMASNKPTLQQEEGK